MTDHDYPVPPRLLPDLTGRTAPTARPPAARPAPWAPPPDRTEREPPAPASVRRRLAPTADTDSGTPAPGPATPPPDTPAPGTGAAPSAPDASGQAPDVPAGASPDGPAARAGAGPSSPDGPAAGAGHRVGELAPRPTGVPAVWAGAHRRPRRRRRLAIVAVVTVLALAGAGTVLLGRNLGAPGCPSGVPATVRVAAAPDIAPVLRSAAAGMPAVRDGCTTVRVTATSAPGLYRRLARGAAPSDVDVWVPDSTAWLVFARAAGSDAFASTGPSLARTPVVIAAPTVLADRFEDRTRWLDFANRLTTPGAPRFSMADALGSTVGLLSVNAVRIAMGGAEADPGIATMRVLTFRSRLASAHADPQALLRSVATAADPASVGAFTATERQVWAYQKAHPATPVRALYPSDAEVEADYPLAVSHRLGAGGRAFAGALAKRFADRTVVRDLAAHGLRGASRDADTAGIVPDAPGLDRTYPAASVPDTRDGGAAVASWAQYRTLPFQVLVLVDGSASMNEKVTGGDGRTRTKAELVRLAGARASTLFGGETSLELREFNTARPGRPDTTIVPYGPIDGRLGHTTRRAALTSAVTRFAVPRRSGTPLYESVLRGRADMAQRFRPDAYTMVVVISDGKDEDSPYAMSRARFLRRLAAQTDRRHPVPVYAVGYGASADMASLTAMAKATGGQAVNSVRAGDLAAAIATIFLAAHKVHP